MAIASTSNNGLPCNTVQDLIEADEHSFWLYTACGLVRIAQSDLDAWAADPKRTIQTRFSTRPTVSGPLDFARPLHGSRTTDGKLWFLTRNGVRSSIPIIFPSTNFRRRSTSSKSRPTTRLTLHSWLAPARLTRDVAIDYTALSLVAPEKNHFDTSSRATMAIGRTPAMGGKPPIRSSSAELPVSCHRLE